MKYLALHDDGTLHYKGEDVAEVATEFERQHVLIKEYLESAEDAFKVLDTICCRIEEMHLSLSTIYPTYIAILKKAGIR